MTRASLWTHSYKLALASKSAARRHMLSAAAIDHVCVEADVDERALEADFFRAGGRAGDLAVTLAKAKALAGRADPDAYCLGADQALLLDDEILHKAGDLEEARARLRRLAAREHILRSAYALARGGEIVRAGYEDATLVVRPLDERAIDAYLGLVGDSVLGSVGCYQIEGLGVALFERVDGAHSTIMGLPILPLLALFRELGLLAF